MRLYYIDQSNGAMHHNQVSTNYWRKLMAYSLLVKTGAAYVGAISILTLAATILS